MLTIIVGVLLTIILCHTIRKISEKSNRHSIFSSNLIITTFSIGISISICLGTFFPLSGYNEWKTEELVSLIPLSEDNELVYVSVSNNIYSFRYEELDNFGNSIRTRTRHIQGNIIEVKNSEFLVFLHRTQKAKISIWTFGQNSRDEYFLFVPEEFISIEQ